MTIDYKLPVHHSTTCRTRVEDGKRFYPMWVFPKLVKRGIDGRRNGSYDWVQLECNDSLCPARLLVRVDSMLIEIGQA